MVLRPCKKVPVKEVSHVINTLNVDTKYKIAHKDGNAFIPLQKKSNDAVMHDVVCSRKYPRTLKEALKGILSPADFKNLKSSFDLIGSIAILEIDEELRTKEIEIAQALLKTNPSIKTVVRKDAIHSGTFRTRKVVHLAGVKTTQTIHKENGVRLVLDIEQVYYSPRSSTERARISSLVEQNENILVMFSGCGPFTCVLAKNTPCRHVTGIELNPKGHAFAQQNKTLNKIKNVTNINGDVRDVVPSLEKFDRILMPLPKSAEDFLDVALRASHNGTTIHFYDFLKEEEFNSAHKKIQSICNKEKKKAIIQRTVKCGQFSPNVFRICIDFKINE